MTHEFGHALGLEHSDEPQASMASTTSIGETTKRDLHQDDVQGFVTLYPFEENPDNNDPAMPNENTNEGSSGGGSVDNAITPAATGGSGNMAPVSLEKAGCTTQSTPPLWLGILWGLIGIRRRV